MRPSASRSEKRPARTGSGRQAVVSQARPSCRRTCWSFLPLSRRCTKGGLYLRGCFPQLCDSAARQLPGGANLTAPKEKPPPPTDGGGPVGAALGGDCFPIHHGSSPIHEARHRLI